MQIINFPSIANADKYAYRFNWKGYNTQPVFKEEYEMFGTHGDGMTQHTGAYAITYAFAVDYLYSLAAAMLENPKLTQSQFDLNAGPKPEAIAFAASIVFKKSDQWEKPRWFSMDLKKISNNPKMEHDKRYTRVESWHDGSARALVNLLTQDYCNGLRRFVIADTVREWANETSHKFATAWNIEAVTEFLKWPAPADEDSYRWSGKIRSAIRAARYPIQMHEASEAAKSCVECYRSNLNIQAAQTAATLQLVAEN